MSIAGPAEKCNKCGRESYHILRKNTKNVGCIECSPERYYRSLESSKSGCFSLLIVFVISIVLFNM